MSDGNTTLKDFFDLLKQHDWFYDYSDDHNSWTRGRNESVKLFSISKESSIHLAMYQAFDRYHFSGDAWGTPKQPEPQLSDFIPPSETIATKDKP